MVSSWGGAIGRPLLLGRFLSLSEQNLDIDYLKYRLRSLLAYEEMPEHRSSGSPNDVDEGGRGRPRLRRNLPHQLATRPGFSTMEDVA